MESENNDDRFNIEKTYTIDGLAYEQDTSSLLLLLTDGMDWSDMNRHLLLFVDGSGVAFQFCGFKPTDATSDDRFNSTIVPVELSEHFIAFSADDDLGEAVVAAIASFFAVGTRFDHSPAD